METSEFSGVCASVLHERMSTLNDEHAYGLKLRAAAMSISVWRRPVSLRTFVSQRLALSRSAAAPESKTSSR